MYKLEETLWLRFLTAPQLRVQVAQTPSAHHGWRRRRWQRRTPRVPLLTTRRAKDEERWHGRHGSVYQSYPHQYRSIQIERKYTLYQLKPRTWPRTWSIMERHGASWSNALSCCIGDEVHASTSLQAPLWIRIVPKIGHFLLLSSQFSNACHVQTS